MDKKLYELLEKEVLTVDEYQEIEWHEEVESTEDCGMSGRGCDYHLYNVIIGNEEYQLLVK